jgi:hypothetical protein
VEVLLDVAYNHTAEGGDEDPYVISLRGIENNTYYMMGGGQVNVGCLRHLLLVCVGAFTNNATFLFCKWASMLVSRPWPYDTVPIPRLCVRVCVCVFVCVCALPHLCLVMCLQMLNYSGCGNTVNVNHPVVMKKVLDSLVKWVTEFHVDGFRFDLSSAMCRGER